MIRFGSVCSGIEAASVAWHPLGWRASFMSEIEAFPRAVLTHHYPDTPLHGDFTTIQAGQYDPIDLLVGGTPCQSFSIAGLRGGLADDRGNLALEYLRLADRLRPRWLVWENVPGVLSSNKGRDFGAILGGMVELGYGFSYRVLDAQYFGVPQRRRRVFVVGYLGDWRRSAAVLFERHSLQGNPAPRREAGTGIAPTIARGSPSGGRTYGLCADTAEGLVPVGIDGESHVGHALTASQTATGRLDPTTQTFAIQERCVCTNVNAGLQGAGYQEGIAYTLEARSNVQYVAHSLRGEGFDASEDGTGRGTPLVPVSYRTAGDGAIYEEGDCTAPLTTATDPSASIVAFQASQSGMRCGGDVHPTLDSNNGSRRHHGAMIGGAVRRLTPRECERLQGFPDDYTLVPYRGKPAADGPRYKALGNSMAVPVMRWIGERIQMVEDLA